MKTAYEAALECTYLAVTADNSDACFRWAALSFKTHLQSIPTEHEEIQ